LDLFFGQELPQIVKDCLLSVDKKQFGFHKDNTLSVEDIVDGIDTACIEGKVYIVYENDILLFFTDQTPYVLKMDSVRGPRGSIFDYTKLIKKVVKLFVEKTLIHKLETRTPFTELDILAKRCKWSHEGTFKESYQMPDGEFVDEYSFGIILHRTKEQEENAMKLLEGALSCQS
jgi:hypothetical protein